MSASNPTSSFFSLYLASGGNPGLTPPFKTPDFIISSKDLACALNVSDKKIRIVNNDLIILLNIFFPLFYLFVIPNVNQK